MTPRRDSQATSEPVTSGVQARQACIPGGFVLLARQIWKSSLWALPDAARILAVHCLMRANHKPGKVNVGGEVIMVERGQFWTSVAALARASGRTKRSRLSTQNVRTALARLQSVQFLTSDATNHGTMITICNYETYQNPENYSDNQTNKRPTSAQQAGNKRLTTNNNDKNDKNDKKVQNTFALSDEKHRSAPHASIVGLPLYEADKKLREKLTDDVFKRWESAYPGVDIPALIKSLHEWEVANPTRQKKNRMKFFVNRLSAQQDRGGASESKPRSRGWTDGI